MEKRLAVIVIHGMGSQEPDFAEPMIEEMNDRVAGLSKNPDAIAWKPIYWADILEPRQLQYLRDSKQKNDLDFVSLRKFMVTSFGDASAYQKVTSTANTTYDEIHARVGSKIADLYNIDLNKKPAPLIILAHSLGGHIMSNYIWDMQKKMGRQWSASLSGFEAMQHLAGIVTFGCNIPLFTFAYKKIEAISFPGENLTNELKKKAKWLNFFDPDDVLGYPLKTISPSYRQVVDQDIPINVGGILFSWNPMSHMRYWTDNDFTKPVAKFIAKFL